jgi:hypothetical protein
LADSAAVASGLMDSTTKAATATATEKIRRRLEQKAFRRIIRPPKPGKYNFSTAYIFARKK